MVMLSMSFGLIKLRKFPLPLTLPPTSIGTPSSTIRGSFEAFSDAPPRIRMVLPADGEPPPLTICTPLTLPLISCSGELMTPWLKSLLLTLETEPVRSLLRCTPYPMTTVSCNTVSSDSKRTVSFPDAGMLTVFVL